MDQFRPRVTTIKGLSERRRLPRLGKIRLGVKGVSRKTGKEYPIEVPHFVVPPEVAKVYGQEPVELDVMFPVNDPGVVFAQAYKWYGSSRGVKCVGDLQTAMRINDAGAMEERECPCELRDKQCNKRGHLLFILPKVSMGGVYQIDTSSANTITDVNSGFDYVEALVGRFAMVPLKLRRVPRETHGSGKKETHYTLILTPHFNIDTLNALRENTKRILSHDATKYLLPPIEDVNPAQDVGAPVILIDEEAQVEKPEPVPEATPEPVPESPAPVEEPEKPEAFLELNSVIHLKLEKHLKTVGREDFLQYLFERGAISKGPQGYDLTTLTLTDACYLLDHFPGVKARFQEWKKTKGPQ
jgi:hypothetical protein